MKNLIIVNLFSVLFLLSCSEKPKANFSWEPLEPKAGEEVQFHNHSINAKRYSWNFGNMSIGNDENPTHVYDEPGKYIIDLQASKGLMSDEATKTITVVE